MKIPAVFRKTYSESEFQAKLLDALFLPADREFLSGLFRAGSDGRLALRTETELQKNELDRLKKLAAALRKNRGIVRLPRLAVLAILVGAMLIFSIVFRNPLMERALENGLSAIFQARVDIDGLDFDPLRARLAWKRAQIADRDRPMFNLLDFGPTLVELSMSGLLRGRFVIEQSSAELRWGTERSVSGALPRSVPEAGIAERKQEEQPGPAISFASIDVQALIEREKEKLAAPRSADRANAVLRGLNQSWSARAAQTRAAIDSAAGSVARLKSINVPALNSLADVQAALRAVEEAGPAMAALSAAAADLRRDFDEAARSMETVAGELDSALRADLAYLQSLVDLTGGPAGSPAAALLDGLIRESLGPWYAYGRRALEIAEAFRDVSADAPAPRPAETPARRSRDFHFPTREGPRFHLRSMSFTAAGPQDEDLRLEGRLSDLSSDPDKLDRPTIFAAAGAAAGKTLGLEGRFHGSRSEHTVMDLGLRAAGWPLQIDFPAPVLDITSYGGQLNLDGRLGFGADGGMRGRADLRVTSPHTRRSTQRSALGELAYDTLRSGELEAAIAWEVSAAGETDVSVSSPLDRTIGRSLENYIRRREAEYRERLQAELDKSLAAALKENRELRAAFESIGRTNTENVADISAHGRTVEEKRRELVQRADDLKRRAAESLLRIPFR